MLDHVLTAPFKVRDATILSSISEAILGERAPKRPQERRIPESQDAVVLKLHHEIVELKAIIEKLSRPLKGVRDILARRVDSSTAEGDVVEFEPIFATHDIERLPDVEQFSYEEPRGLFAHPPFTRRHRSNAAFVRTRVGDGLKVDLAPLPKIGLKDGSDRPSATVIPFPIERAVARKVSAEENAFEAAFAPTLVDDASGRLDEEVTEAGDTSPNGEDLLVAKQISADEFVLVTVPEVALDKKVVVANATYHDTVRTLTGEVAGSTPSNSMIFISTEPALDEGPIVDASDRNCCHRGWTRAQQRHFTAYASVGHSAKSIARLMEQACGESVSVKTVRLALADRIEKLERAKPRKSPSRIRASTL